MSKKNKLLVLVLFSLIWLLSIPAINLRPVFAQQPCNNPALPVCQTCGQAQCIQTADGSCYCGRVQNPGGGAPQQGGGAPQNPGGGAPVNPNNPFGSIINPLPAYQSVNPGGGLILLITNILRLVFIVGGILAFIRLILAGLKFISSSGDPKAIEAAWNSIWQSLLGLVIMISAFAIAGLLGYLLFGTSGSILNPVIYTP